MLACVLILKFFSIFNKLVSHNNYSSQTIFESLMFSKRIHCSLTVKFVTGMIDKLIY